LERLPDLNQKFAEWYRSIFRDGALDQKMKELIGLAASLTAGCQA